uniref:Uncharacterized protein n=1 Tax=Cyanistes caeruleus TaxID=156563 RepID=A0A8C0UCT8_CYACU
IKRCNATALTLKSWHRVPDTTTAPGASLQGTPHPPHQSSPKTWPQGTPHPDPRAGPRISGDTSSQTGAAPRTSPQGHPIPNWSNPQNIPTGTSHPKLEQSPEHPHRDTPSPCGHRPSLGLAELQGAIAADGARPVVPGR